MLITEYKRHLAYIKHLNNFLLQISIIRILGTYGTKIYYFCEIFIVILIKYKLKLKKMLIKSTRKKTVTKKHVK